MSQKKTPMAERSFVLTASDQQVFSFESWNRPRMARMDRFAKLDFPDPLGAESVGESSGEMRPGRPTLAYAIPSGVCTARESGPPTAGRPDRNGWNPGIQL